MTDKYALPSQTLKRAKHLIAEGKTRQDVAKAILSNMLRAAEKNPALKERIGYLHEPVNNALHLIETRLRVCDASCAEHAHYKTTLQRAIGRERNAMLKKRRREDPEWREEQNRKAREYVKKKKAESPAFRDYIRQRNNDTYQKRMEDPVWRENRNLRMQAYGQRPEVKARTKQQAQERRAKRNARRAVDPEFDAECRRQQAERNRKWLRNLRENHPAKYEAHLEKRRRKSRERYHASKTNGMQR